MLDFSSMSPSGRVFSAATSALLALLAVAAVDVAAAAVETSDLRRLKGRVVCLETTDEGSQENPCDEPEARYAFHAESGVVLTFLVEDQRAGMFADPLIREQPLMIEGWIRDGGTIELLEVFSIKDGVLHHIHYRCDICDITATAPGPCWCCGQDFDLRETPVEPAPGAGR